MHRGPEGMSRDHSSCRTGLHLVSHQRRSPVTLRSTHPRLSLTSCSPQNPSSGPPRPTWAVSDRSRVACTKRCGYLRSHWGNLLPEVAKPNSLPDISASSRS